MNNQQHLEALKSLRDGWGDDHKFVKLVNLIICLLDMIEPERDKFVSEDGFPFNLKIVMEKIYEEINAEASGLFINSKGQASGVGELKIATAGLLWVGPGELDSFGWLTGIVHANGVKFVYG